MHGSTARRVTFLGARVRAHRVTFLGVRVRAHRVTFLGARVRAGMEVPQLPNWGQQNHNTPPTRCTGHRQPVLSGPRNPEMPLLVLSLGLVTKPTGTLPGAASWYRAMHECARTLPGRLHPPLSVQSSGGLSAPPSGHYP